MNVRRWDKIVASWAAGDHQGLDDAWTADVLPDLGSQWGQYEYVKKTSASPRSSLRPAKKGSPAPAALTSGGAHWRGVEQLGSSPGS
ncbi:hypothetical protein GCM10020295_00140 [Streptomyces cinereospinus]